MNAKRRKLNSEDVSASEFVFQSFKTEDYLAILKDLSFIKQKFCKTKIDDESKNEQILSQIFVLVDLFYKIVNNNEYNADKQQSKVLQEAISIIANLCYYSSAAKLYMSKARNPAILFSTLEQLLKKDNVLDKIKNNILRLVGNLILAPCTMVYFTTNDTLLSKIADFLGAEDENQKENAIKIFKNFASMKFPAAFLNNSAIQRIGEMILVEEQITKYKEDLIKILYFTFSYMKTVAGKQLAITQCPTLLLSKLQGYVNEETEDSEWSRCICSILNKSHDVREAIGTSGLISFIDNGKECLSFWKVLSYFAQDAWGRVTLREYSGLDLIINHLLTSNDVVEKCLLYEALRHFIHDSVGIAYLCMKGDLFRAILKDTTAYLSHTPMTCHIKIKDGDIFRPFSPPFEVVKPALTSNYYYTGRQNEKASTTSPVNKSPSPSSRSPSFSPKSTDGDSVKEDILGFKNFYQDENTFTEIEVMNQIKYEEKMAMASFCVVSWQTHDVKNHKYLVTNDTLTIWIKYLAFSPIFDQKAARGLKRIAKSSPVIDTLLKNKFHLKILQELVRRNCMLHIRAVPCDCCEQKRQFGRELYKDFRSNLVDTEFGWSFIDVEIRTGDPDRIANAFIAFICLIRGLKRKTILHLIHDPISYLVNKAKSILKDDENIDKCNSLGEKNVDIFFEIIVTLNTLISKVIFIKALEVPKEDADDNCEYECLLPENNNQNLIDYITFKNRKLNEIVYVSKENLCNTCTYYKMLFESKFRDSNDSIFYFEDHLTDITTWEDFKKFIHFISGCKGQRCIEVETVDTCLNLISLSDQLICKPLVHHLTKINGSVMNLFSGDSIKLLIPACLYYPLIFQEIQAYCFITYLGFTTKEQIFDSMASFKQNPGLINEFFDKMLSFLKESFESETNLRGFLV